MTGLPNNVPSSSYSCLVKQLGLGLNGNNLLSFSLRASQPQSTPVTSLNQSTAALMPVAVVILSTTSPSPLGLLRFLVVPVLLVAGFLDFGLSILECVKN